MFSPVDMLQRSFHVFLLFAEAHWIFLCRGSIVSSVLIVWLEVRPDSGFLPIGQPTTEVSKHPIRRSVRLLYEVCHLRLTFETVLDFLLMGVNNDFPRPRSWLINNFVPGMSWFDKSLIAFIIPRRKASLTSAFRSPAVERGNLSSTCRNRKIGFVCSKAIISTV